MKEAAGEANMTVITIVLIAIVLGIGTIIVTNVMGNTKKSSACQSCGGVWKSGACYATDPTTGGATSTPLDYNACLGDSTASS